MTHTLLARQADAHNSRWNRRFQQRKHLGDRLDDGVALRVATAHFETHLLECFECNVADLARLGEYRGDSGMAKGSGRVLRRSNPFPNRHRRQ